MIFKNKIESVDTKEIVYSGYINWDYFKNSTIMITGATGLIGFQIILAIMYANEVLKANIKILALVRNKKKASKMFARFNSKNIKLLVQDILEPINYKNNVDFIIHTANTTSSEEMTIHPVETIDSIVVGTKNVLEFAKKIKPKSIVYLSSMEVYGDIPLSQKEPLKEDDLGKLDTLKPRSSYPMGKRLAESLCTSYAKEYNVPVKIARLAQTIGAGVEYNDNRVFAQFARNIVEKNDIVLKTKGETTRSYIYITDCIAALLKMLEVGISGECYNIANPDTTCSIKDMAEMLVNKYKDSKLRFEIDDKPNFYLKTLKYELNTAKFESLSSWRAVVSIDEAFDRLISAFYCFQAGDRATTKFKKTKFIEKIFSSKNTETEKIITILGFEIKKDLKSVYIDYMKRQQKLFGIKKNKIVFSNYKGQGFGCNPKYIAKEIIKRKLPVEIVWLVRKDIPQNQFPKEIRTVYFNSKKAYKELATSKIWVDNYHKIYNIKKGMIKSPEQIYIQTWHGSLGIKKIEKNVNMLKKDALWEQYAIENSKMTDYWISNSAFEDDVYKNGFWDVNNILRFGHPRNDIFFKDNTSLVKKIKKQYKLSEYDKILLYAPTFREDESLSFYNMDVNKIKSALSKQFGGNWVILMRLHPRMMKFSDVFFKGDKDIIDVSDYPDMQELLCAVDAGITDYSSWMFDFMLSRKPVFIYAEDIEDYNTERGFYYPLETTPFPIARNNDELIKNIENFDDKKYIKEVDKFLKDKGCVEDGQASKRVVDLIESVINEQTK